MKATARTLRLILGDQLNWAHHWFKQPDEDVLYVMMEIRQETDYVRHHAQKVIAIFAAMREFARQLSAEGHRVHYLHIDDLDNQQSLQDNLTQIITHCGIQHFEFQAPDEWRLDQQLDHYAHQLPISTHKTDTDHFLTKRSHAARHFNGNKRWLMETFYRRMRQKYNVLMDESGNPLGGKWNYDHQNRKAWSGTPAEPTDSRPLHDHSALWHVIQQAGIQTMGEPQATSFRWPLSRAEALAQLERFIIEALPYFGEFQDAMSLYGQRLFHSQLSFALNVKMISPQEVIQRVERAYHDGLAPLAAVEGYIRQIIGWREYIRGVYWHKMPTYLDQNIFAHERALPTWFWNGKTRMRCLHEAICQSLNEAHAHHIQRLMVIGNFALLAGLSPQAVHEWYLGVYIDAFEWVELPNTLGMSQFADGGALATKPYVSTAAYIDRMSDYCQQCHYRKKERTGPYACPFNALYWDFYRQHHAVLGNNPRISMVYRQLDRMDAQTRIHLQHQAIYWRQHLDEL